MRVHLSLSMLLLLLIVTWFFNPALAVATFSRFEARYQDGAVLVEWDTASEIDNIGFYLYRSQTADERGQELAFVPSQGDLAGASYRFTDTDVQPGASWYYTIESMDVNGNSSLHGPVRVEVPVLDTPTFTPSPSPAPTSTPTMTPMPFLPTAAPSPTWTPWPTVTPTPASRPTPTRTPMSALVWTQLSPSTPPVPPPPTPTPRGQTPVTSTYATPTTLLPTPTSSLTATWTPVPSPALSTVTQVTVPPPANLAMIVPTQPVVRPATEVQRATPTAVVAVLPNLLTLTFCPTPDTKALARLIARRGNHREQGGVRGSESQVAVGQRITSRILLLTAGLAFAVTVVLAVIAWRVF